VNFSRLLDRAQVVDEEEKIDDEEDNDLLKAFKVLTNLWNGHISALVMNICSRSHAVLFFTPHAYSPNILFLF